MKSSATNLFELVPTLYFTAWLSIAILVFQFVKMDREGEDSYEYKIYKFFAPCLFTLGKHHH